MRSSTNRTYLNKSEGTNNGIFRYLKGVLMVIYIED